MPDSLGPPGSGSTRRRPRPSRTSRSARSGCTSAPECTPTRATSTSAARPTSASGRSCTPPTRPTPTPRCPWTAATTSSCRSMYLVKSSGGSSARVTFSGDWRKGSGAICVSGSGLLTEWVLQDVDLSGWPRDARIKPSAGTHSLGNIRKSRVTNLTSSTSTPLGLLGPRRLRREPRTGGAGRGREQVRRHRVDGHGHRLPHGSRLGGVPHAHRTLTVAASTDGCQTLRLVWTYVRSWRWAQSRLRGGPR